MSKEAAKLVQEATKGRDVPVAIKRCMAELIDDAIKDEREACARTAESLGAYGGNNADVVIAGMIRDRSKR